MNIAPKPPLARQGQQLASQGRYGDSQLVHMNPYEVQGLAAMSPTGQLTKNPVTGQPEAFLPFLAPLLGKAIGTKLLAGKVGAGLAGAIGSGLGTFAESGSLEKGLVSGITGFGLGKVFNAGAEAVNAGTEVAQATAAQQGLQEATKAAGNTLSPDLLEASKILQQPNSMVNAATLGDTLGSNVSTPLSYDVASGATIGGNVVNPISSQAQDFLDASQAAGTATSALDSARQGISFGDRLSSFRNREGLEAMGQAALRPENLLTIGSSLGVRGQMEVQDDMQRRADEAADADNAYAQGFKNVLTDTLGMSRGSNPNPYMSRYIGNYANGGLVRMNGGGDTEYGGNVESKAEEIIRSVGNYGLDSDDRYFIKPSKGSAAERQSFLRGFEKQDPPTDYRHGFEEEFQFFDFVKDRPIERYQDLFGAGPSDYLAGLLAASPERLEELGTPIAEGTRPLAEYTDTRGTPFSGVDNFSDMGVTKADPITDIPVASPVTSPVVVDESEEVVDSGNVVPEYMQAIQALGLPVDGEYVRPEGRAVYDVLDEYDAFGAEEIANVADYFGVDAAEAQANVDVIAQNRATQELLDSAIEGGIEQVDPDQEAADPYTQGEIDAVVGLIDSEQLSLTAAAEYFQVPYEQVKSTYDNIVATRAAETPTEELGSAYSDLINTAVESAGGGRMPKKRIMTRAGVMELANGGIAEAVMGAPEETMVVEETVVEQMPDDAMFDNGMGDLDFDNMVAMTVEAIRGNVQDADKIIEMFIDEYGVDQFRSLREAVLQSIVPGAQTEGKIVGSGGGMDDEVMGMIGENQPVAVAPDEYIVAADVVSGLGDGSSEAGADILDQMMADVRTARTGGRQPAPIDKSAVLPA